MESSYVQNSNVNRGKTKDTEIQSWEVQLTKAKDRWDLIKHLCSSKEVISDKTNQRMGENICEYLYEINTQNIRGTPLSQL